MLLRLGKQEVTSMLGAFSRQMHCKGWEYSGLCHISAHYCSVSGTYRYTSPKLKDKWLPLILVTTRKETQYGVGLSSFWNQNILHLKKKICSVRTKCGVRSCQLWTAIREAEASVAGLGCRTSSSASWALYCLAEVCSRKMCQVADLVSPRGTDRARLCRELHAFWKISLLLPLGAGRDGMSHHGAHQMTMWSELASLGDLWLRWVALSGIHCNAEVGHLRSGINNAQRRKLSLYLKQMAETTPLVITATIAFIHLTPTPPHSPPSACVYVQMEIWRRKRTELDL